MRRKLSNDEKEQARAERLDYERRWFLDIDVIVDDYTSHNGDPVVHVISQPAKRND